MPAKKDPDGMNVDIKLVRDLAGILDKAGLTEIEVEDGDRKVRVSRSGGAVVSAPVAAVAAPAPAPAAPRHQPQMTTHTYAPLTTTTPTPSAAPPPPTSMPMVLTTSASQPYTVDHTRPAVSPTTTNVPQNHQMDAATTAAYYKPVPNPLA